MKDGEFIDYYPSGEILSKCWYLGGEFHGEVIYYFTFGGIFSKSYYIDGNRVTELKWLSYNRNLKFELIGL